MNQEELLLWNIREKQRKKRSTDDELDEDLVFENVPKFKQAPARAANTSTNFNVDTQTNFDDNYKLSSSLTGNASLSVNDASQQSSTQNISFKNISTADITSPALVSAKVQTSSDSTTASSSASSLSSSSFATSPVIANFAIVKMTGADNFFKSAYTVGKGASIRATKAIDYIMRDGAFKDESNEATELRAQKHIDYMSRDEVKGSGGVLYDKNGNEISDSQAKSMMQDITGERRLVFSPNSNVKMTNAEFSKVITKTINTFSQDFHKNFDYTFAIHRNTDNPHAHLILTTKDVGGDGVKMFKDELFEIKQRFYENTKQLAMDKSDRYEIFYKDKSYFSEAKQIAGFTGDMPTSKFANQNTYLIKKIATAYKIPINEKALNSADKIKGFFEEHSDKYNEFITNAKNRYADTFTKYYKDSLELSEKYSLGEVPKDVEQFKAFLDENQKLFLADKIATDKGLELSSKHLKDDITINKWFTANKEKIKEWNTENEPRISKELYNRFEHLNNRVDKPFEIPQKRIDGITLNNHYKLDKMIFANDTRKALVDVVEARIKYFQQASKSNEVSKEEKKTNIERLDGLRGKIKAYDDITESSLKKYGIDTNCFSKDEKIVEMDGIRLEHGDNGVKFDSLLTKAIQNPEFTPEQKDKIEKISHVADKQQQVSVSALENAGFKREELLKEFSVEKIETKQQIINFKKSDEARGFGNINLKEWKQDNLDNFKLAKPQVSDKQINFAQKIANKLYEDVDFSKMNTLEVGKYINDNGTAFNSANLNPNEHLLSVDASKLSSEQQENYFRDLTRAEMFSAFKKDIDTLELLDLKHEKEFPQDSLVEKQIKIDLYATALDIKSKDYLEVMVKEHTHLQFEENIKKYGLDTPIGMANELKSQGLSYQDEKYRAMADLIVEKQFDKLMEKHDGTNDRELENRNSKMIGFVDGFKEQLEQTREYEAKIDEIENAVAQNDVFRAMNLVEQVEEHDMRGVELKINAAIEARFESVELELQKEFKLESKFLNEELEAAREVKIENLIENGNFRTAEIELKNGNLDSDIQQRLEMKLELFKSMQHTDEPLFDDFKMQTQKDEQQNEDNQKVKDAALQEKALEDINVEKEQIRSSGMGM
ncbi:hypothetical protein Suden_0806 [Sulfurimonas denitrificans DSM 1251]|uniref:Relaxase n=1 Tax=Sulfurimonas denitrificans (strain ATCC 33889 / DSM 1251) TaxID=326298 RepID=Q30SE6_SULDN|nr:hypothetical protein [Sulfurimonas denitrificans]ABB44085.1 hypothetical protein Suden_0806 [Sulfurimonas denitrificans DSM 1251]